MNLKVYFINIFYRFGNKIIKFNSLGHDNCEVKI